MKETTGTTGSYRDVQRRLLAQLPSATRLSDEGAPLEIGARTDPPRLSPAQVMEKGGAMRAWRVDGDPEVGIAAFLDGTQRSRVVSYVGGHPVVHAVVAAVVRRRLARRLTTWPRGPRIERALYAPREYVGEAAWTALQRCGVALVDTTVPDANGERAPAHPIALAQRALDLVKADRTRVEKELAEEWCALEKGALLIDGGIRESDVVAKAPCTIGVVKSHHTLYFDGPALASVFALRRAERSSVFRVASSRRTPVASWYLRLRDATGRDPLWGLVRIEAAESAGATESPEALATRANQISRWILAEVTPLALPDGRWDKLVYGVRDCEEYLRAVNS